MQLTGIRGLPPTRVVYNLRVVYTTHKNKESEQIQATQMNTFKSYTFRSTYTDYNSMMSQGLKRSWDQI